MDKTDDDEVGVPKPGDIRLEPEPGQAFVLQPYELDGTPVPRNEAVQRRRERRARARIEKRTTARICADGDSWINILYPLSKPFGHQATLFDILEDHYGHNNTENVAFPGDTFSDMLDRKDYRGLLTANTWDYFIFSGGGNDFLGGLGNLLRRKSDVKGTTPADCLKKRKVNSAFAGIKRGYIEIAKDVAKRAPRVKMLVHSYDYPIPRENGPYLGKRLTNLEYDLVKDKELIAGILKLLIDQFHQTLTEVAKTQRHVQVVSLRGLVKHWNDELHPKKKSSEDLAQVFIRIIG
jgi:hypothetical protein